MFNRFISSCFNRNLLLIVCFVISIACLDISKGFAQQVETSNSDLSYWVHGGTGISTLGPGLHGGIIFDYKRHVFSLRATSTDLSYGTETWDIALLYGRSMSYKTFYLSGGVGAAVIGGASYSHLLKTNNKSTMHNTLGFPLEGQILWEPFNYVGLGVYSYVNVNTEQPFGGIGFSLRVGNF